MSTGLAGTFKSLMRNRLQASLTLIGMSVGVAMVVIVSGLGLGAHQKIEAQLQSAGPTLITVKSGNYTPPGASSAGEEDASGGEVSQGGGAMSVGDGADSTAAAAANPNVQAARSVVHQSQFRSPATPLGDDEMRMISGMKDVTVVAASMDGNVSLAADAGVLSNVVHVNGFEAAWPDMQVWRLAAGRWITDSEHQSGAAVAMLSANSAARLWPNAVTPVGQTLKFNGHALQIVGTFTTPENPDNDQPIIIPQVYTDLPEAKTLMGRSDYDSITVRAGAVDVMSALAKRISARLRDLHKLSPQTFDDFRVQTESAAAMKGLGMATSTVRSVHSNMFNLDQASYEEMARSLRKAGRTFSLLLAGGAAVSLLVGGIGVMNIMLVAVTARTREIGLRVAVGARTRDVLLQFLSEAIVLATLGGLLGVVIGALSLDVVRSTLHWATAISPTMLVLALLMAAITGVVFGYGPARRAAILDPVIALKAE
ncbi:MAG TPA: ABC transporter permease [Steroidobacteraceae bacterium]|jgi:ABC-type antimicrobial peptide transport system permease subunit